jgi:class I fructose-bisphosphate aldolase
MQITPKVKEILSWYASENNGVKTNLARILMHGHLAGTGKMVILPVDQGFEHGPDRSFAPNAPAYDPAYHFKIALTAGLNAYAAPLAMLEASANDFTGQIPLIVKLNSAISLNSKDLSPTQVMTASVADALRIGASAVGITIYPGSNDFYSMMPEVREVIAESKASGLPVVVWSYPRGQGVSKEGETAIDVCSYAGHIAALIGANIIKLKLPANFIESQQALEVYQQNAIPTASLQERVAHIMRSAFNGKRLVVFSGMAAKNEQQLLEEVKMIHAGTGSGSIIGRNSFQRPFNEAVELLTKICQVYSV